MNIETKLSKVEELALELDQAVTRLQKEFAAFSPETQGDLQAFLAGRVAELSANNRADVRGDIKEQCAAIRVELSRLVEAQMRIVLEKRQEVVGLSELRAGLTELAENAAAGYMKEYARRHREELPIIVRKEFSALPTITQPSEVFSLAESFTGNYDPERLYEKDEVFTFRGSSYLVLRQCRGILPSRQSQHGENAVYGLIAAAGAPGRSTGSGDVSGANSSTDNAVARWDGTTGKLLQTSVVTVSDTGALAGVTTGAYSGLQTLTPGSGIAGWKMAGGGIAQYFDSTAAEVARLAAASNVMKHTLIAAGGSFSFRDSSDNPILTLADTGKVATLAGTVIHTLSATPASAAAAGVVGTISWDADYIYICTATNTWKRVGIATW